MKRNGRTESTLRLDLGSIHHHTVYEGEIVGMILATELLRRTRGRISTVSLGLDNSLAAIQASTAFRSGPGQYLMDAFHENLQTALDTQGVEKITIWWTPGHSGIPGNEEADIQAKEAAKGVSSPAHSLPRSLRKGGNRIKQLPKSKSATKQRLRERLKAARHKVFGLSPRARHARAIVDTLPSHNFLKLIAELPKRHAAILFQLRTGRAPLNKHLPRLAKINHPHCNVCPHHHETPMAFVNVLPSVRSTLPAPPTGCWQQSQTNRSPP